VSYFYIHTLNLKKEEGERKRNILVAFTLSATGWRVLIKFKCVKPMKRNKYVLGNREKGI